MFSLIPVGCATSRVTSLGCDSAQREAPAGPRGCAMWGQGVPNGGQRLEKPLVWFVVSMPRSLSLGMAAPSIQCSPHHVSPACPLLTHRPNSPVLGNSHKLDPDFHPVASFFNFQFIKKVNATTTGSLLVQKRGCLPSFTPSLSPHTQPLLPAVALPGLSAHPLAQGTVYAYVYAYVYSR